MKKNKQILDVYQGKNGEMILFSNLILVNIKSEI